MQRWKLSYCAVTNPRQALRTGLWPWDCTELWWLWAPHLQDLKGSEGKMHCRYLRDRTLNHIRVPQRHCTVGWGGHMPPLWGQMPPPAATP